jgi:hypothetical protein
MDPIPGFGGAVGFRRLYSGAVARTWRADMPESDKRAWIAEKELPQEVAGLARSSQ